MNVLRSIGSDADRPTGPAATLLGLALVCLWAARFAQELVPSSWSRLGELNWWAGTQVLFYGIVPVAGLRLLGIRPSDIGWRVTGIARHGGIYLGLFAVALPFVVIASATGDFQEHYPILEITSGETGFWGELAIWWPVYAAQFVAIEAFFRGVLVLGLSRWFGSMAILLAAVPYMMIHFVKPPAEAAASIVGGVVLGFLALRTRSIVWGIALHIAVAASMDLASLARKGLIW